MAVVVLVLWLFTAGAGFYLLLTSSLAHPAPTARATPEPIPATVTPAPATPAPATREPAPATVTPAPAATVTAPSRREAKRAARERFDPPSLVAARNAPMVPGLRSLLEFAHPACGLLGLAGWLGYTLVRYRPLAWIAFGLVLVTACAGLAWFTANTRAAKARAEKARPSRAPASQDPESQGPGSQAPESQALKSQGPGSQDPGSPGLGFSARLIVIHGAAAAVTLTLAALIALRVA